MTRNNRVLGGAAWAVLFSLAASCNGPSDSTSSDTTPNNSASGTKGATDAGDAGSPSGNDSHDGSADSSHAGGAKNPGGSAGSGGSQHAAGSSGSGTSGGMSGSGGMNSGGGAGAGGIAGMSYPVTAICDDPALTEQCKVFVPTSHHWDAALAAKCGNCYFDDLNRICKTVLALPTLDWVPGCWLSAMLRCQNGQYRDNDGKPIVEQALTYDDLVKAASVFCAVGSCRQDALYQINHTAQCTLP